MTANSDDPVTISESYILALRSCEIGNETIFRKDSDKYYLETLVRYSMDKIGAMQYHQDRIFDIVGSALRGFDDLPNLSNIPRKGTIESTLRVIIEDKKVAYELSGFLTSIRSLLDFVARIVSCYLKAQKHQSIQSLERFLSKFTVESLSQLMFDEWSDWIKYVREYRDNLIHNISLTTKAAVEVKTFPTVGGPEANPKRFVNKVPFLIPVNPEFVYIVDGLEEDDTILGDSEYLAFEEEKRNGKTMRRVVDFKRMVDLERHIDVREFTKRYSKKAKNFYVNILSLLLNNGFTYFTITEHGSAGSNKK